MQWPLYVDGFDIISGCPNCNCVTYILHCCVTTQPVMSYSNKLSLFMVIVPLISAFGRKALESLNSKSNSSFSSKRETQGQVQ